MNLINTPTPEIQSWQDVHDEFLRRIRERIWPPGEQIPNEADLAIELGCARTTINRALRTLADAGLVERRRKAGTRVSLHPVRKAIFDIPIVRQEIEQRGDRYSCSLILRKKSKPPRRIASQLKLDAGDLAAHLETLHFANDKPYLYEDRWVNLQTVPGIWEADLDSINANEWLIQNMPLSTGSINFSAENASKKDAELLGTSEGSALFIVERITWLSEQSITAVRLAYAPGYHLHTTI